MFKKIASYGMILMCAALFALSYHLFVFPNRFAPAGINGICTMIQHVFHINMGYLSLLINLPLALLSFFLADKLWSIRTMVFTLAFSLLVLVLEKVDLTIFAYNTQFSAVLGPMVAGLAVGYLSGMLGWVSAGTGGTEFIARVIYRYRPHMNFYWVIFALNISVAVLSYFVYDFQIEPVLLCVVYSFASSVVREKMEQSRRKAVRFEIVTQYPEEISTQIMEKLHHGITLLPAKGMFRGEERSVLVCIINKTQIPELKQIVCAYPKTFAAMSQVEDVYGNFKRLDSQGKPERHITDIMR